MLNLNELKWKEFDISGDNGLFKIASTSSSIDKNKLVITDFGKIPYITRTELNNGINQFIGENQKVNYKMDKGDVITIGLDTQTVFYQAHHFFTGQNIQVLKHEELNKFNALFTIPLIKIQMEKFNWGGNGATLGRLSRTKIMLPINKKNEADFEYMQQYSKSIIDIKIAKYVYYAKSVIKNLKIKEIEKLEDKEWKEFTIEELFDVKIGKNIDGNKINKINGSIPYITRKENNNGLDGFVDYDSSFLNKEFPVITIGNETATPFVQTSYKFFTGTKVNIMKLKNCKSKEVLFFISQSIKQQKSKYSYSITINSTRLKRQKILLPINEEGNPDYQYMEQYIKNLMYKKVNQYINYIQKMQVVEQN